MSPLSHGLKTKTMSITADDAKSFDRHQGFVVCVLEGAAEDRGKHLTLLGGSVLVGSASDVDLRLHDERVSRHHLELSMTGSAVRVRDLGSRNGTQVGGVRIESGEVTPGVRITVGATVLTVVERGSEPLTAASGPREYDALVGASSAMLGVFDMLSRIEGTELPVLVLGETGVGKELIARAIHRKSRRASGPYVVLDCAAMARDVAESEIFGHVRGAYTGAAGDRAGAFEQAHGGTIFIDELGELPMELQPRLLRVLETGEVKRVGDNRVRTVDVRVVAATNRDLRQEIIERRFREDLYYRLAVVTMAVPPLRDRPGDVPLLIRRFAKEAGKLDAATLEDLERTFAGHTWPGNVRELRNTVLRLLALGTTTTASALPMETTARGAVAATAAADGAGTSPGADVDVGLPYKDNRDRVLNAFEARYLAELLARHGGNVSAAARGAGMARSHLRTLLAKHGLSGRDDAE